MTQMAEGSAALNTYSPSGKQANGETGRSKLMTGFATRLIVEKRPTKNPMGMPINAAKPKPMPTALRNRVHSNRCPCHLAQLHKKDRPAVF